MSTRTRNRLKRNERIRTAYAERYTDAPRPRMYSREYILAQLAEEYCLSIATVETILYTSDEVPAAA